MKKRLIKINDKVNVTTNSAVDTMSLYELCRWASLKDAIDLIGEKCEERNIDFDTFEVKPLDLLKYVDSMTDDLYNKAIEANKS